MVEIEILNYQVYGLNIALTTIANRDYLWLSSVSNVQENSALTLKNPSAFANKIDVQDTSRNLASFLRLGRDFV